MAPLSPYGSSKAAAEILCMQMARSGGIDLVATRSFPHYGPGQSTSFALPAFCGRILDARKRGASGISVGNLAPVRDYLHIDDVCRAYATILARGERLGVYNVCSGHGVSMRELLDRLIALAGASVKPVRDEELFRDIDVTAQVGDNGRLSALGWAPEVGIDAGLESLLAWWEERTG